DAPSILRRDLQRAAIATLHQRRQVVHERVAAAQVAPADEQQVVRRRTEPGAQAVEVVDDRRWRQLDDAALGVDDLAQPRLQRPEIDTVRGLLHGGGRQPARLTAESVSMRSDGL